MSITNQSLGGQLSRGTKGNVCLQKEIWQDIERVFHRLAAFAICKFNVVSTQM